MPKALLTSQSLLFSGLNRQYLNLIYKGRLRLGMIRKLDKMLIANFLTFGIASWPQSRRLYWELVWHLEGSPVKFRPVFQWLLPIPGLNIYSAWQISKVILEMERQNHDPEIKISIAMALSLCPPLLIVYWQHLANKHWLSHAVAETNKDSLRKENYRKPDFEISPTA